MERPMSRDHPPPTSTPKGHTRNPSSSTKSASHSLISLFATNLRLLGLDTHPDCPAPLTLHTFINPTDSRTRIRTAEFALYHLFRLYHPATAADKLRPFYPPLEPLQSVNLRAALFRCLDNLKKNGVLGRETVLRKSMLDECQGEKFWELCLTFSALVLRKSVLEREERGTDEFGVPIAERLGTASGLRRSEKDVLTPLAIAHRVILSRGLDEREGKKQAFARLYDVLVEKEAELARRKEKVQQTASGLADQVASVDGVEQSVKKGWHGNRELQKVLINGDTSAGGDAVLTRPLHKLTAATDKELPQTDRGLLVNLAYSATRQQHRVRKWQSMHESLLTKRQPTSIPATIPEEGTRAGILRFDKHHDLSIRDTPLPPPSSPNRLPPPPSRQDSVVSRYDDILTSMREELRQRNRRNGNFSSSRSPERHRDPSTTSSSSFSRRQSQVARKPSFQIDTAAGALSQQQQQQQQQQDPHQRSASETAVPMRPSMARRASSRSRSYQQPKVEGMRQPIPLKSEVFSPLKAGSGSGSRRGSAASPSPLVAAAESIVASPVQEKEEREEQGFGGNSDGSGNEVDVRQRQGVRDGKREGRVSSQGNGDAHQKIDSAVGLGIDSSSVLKAKAKMGETGSEPASNDDGEEEAGAERISIPDRESKIPALPSKRDSEAEESREQHPPTSPRRGTLADRTLVSLSGKRGSHEAPSRPSSSSSSSPTGPNDLIVVETAAEEPLPHPISTTETSSPNPTTPAPLARHTSLSDRARQTMAMGPPPSATANKSLVEVEFQSEEEGPDDDQLVQHEVSRLPRAGTTGQAGRKTRRDLTPRENLFSPDADMDSVFKARPRVAVSPVGVSPFREGGDEKEEEDGVRGFGSSPLGGR
ncbi:hypothetical protein KC331_g12559 [Hortaea werneckii]|nr:hypothetical protein KC331_g12559 [Hortaea werneckii]KAI7719535.1 hypothetical protein KC353_g2900 [Hortaea werneckii]